MKIELLKSIIREEVRSAVRAEVQEVIIEAMKIASTPTNPIQEVSKKQSETTSKKPVDITPIREQFKKLNPIEQMLEETKLSFSSQDAKNFANPIDLVQGRTAGIAENLGLTGPEPGLDLSSLPFLKNAKKVLDLSKEKDKERAGGY